VDCHGRLLLLLLHSRTCEQAWGKVMDRQWMLKRTHGKQQKGSEQVMQANNPVAVSGCVGQCAARW
jgi:hypothetical protein